MKNLKMKKEFKVIADLLPNNTRVLDVGCGDGSLMNLLYKKKNIEVMNISNRIMNIFPESHSDSVIYTYSSSPTIFDAINSPSSSNLLRN